METNSLTDSVVMVVVVVVVMVTPSHLNSKGFEEGGLSWPQGEDLSHLFVIPVNMKHVQCGFSCFNILESRKVWFDDRPVILVG